MATNEKAGRLHINVGAGSEALPGYVNLDNSPFLVLATIGPVIKFILGPEKLQMVQQAQRALASGNMVRHDCRKKLPFPDKSVEHVLCSHFLEHVWLGEIPQILTEFYRVLKLGGTVHLIVPDLERAVEDYYKNRSTQTADKLVKWTLMSTPSKPSLRYRLMEFFGFEGLKHRWMYDRQSLADKVLTAGFLICDDTDIPSAFYRKDCNESLHVFAVKKV